MVIVVGSLVCCAVVVDSVVGVPLLGLLWLVPLDGCWLRRCCCRWHVRVVFVCGCWVLLCVCGRRMCWLVARCVQLLLLCVSGGDVGVGVVVVVVALWPNHACPTDLCRHAATIRVRNYACPQTVVVWHGCRC